MKKLMFCLLLTMAGICGYSQAVLFPNSTPQGNAATLDYDKGGRRPDSALIISPRIYTDTTEANFSVVKFYSGCLIQVSGGQLWYRVLLPYPKWLLVSSSSGGPYLLIADTAAMLSNRLKISDTTTMLSNRLKISDTATMKKTFGNVTIAALTTTAGATIGGMTQTSTPYLVYATAAGALSYFSAPAGGTLTNISVTTANGVSATITNPTTTPNLTFTLGAITPSSVISSGAISGTTLTGNLVSALTFGNGLTSTASSYNNSSGLTLKVDTSTISTKANATALLLGKLNLSDTATMLSNYNAGVGYGLLRTAKSPFVDTSKIIPYTDTAYLYGVATKTFLNTNYLPLTGGTMTGNILFTGNTGIGGANFILQTKDGSNTAGLSAYTGWLNGASTDGVYAQNNASNDLSFFGRTSSVNSGVVATISRAGNITATKHITTGGSSSQFVKGDGSLDNTAYGLGTVTLVLTNNGTGINGGPIGSAGSLSIDTTIISTKANVTAKLIGAVYGTGSATQVAFWGSSNSLSGTNNLYWDNGNGRLGINKSNPSNSLDVIGNELVTGQITASQSSSVLNGNTVGLYGSLSYTGNGTETNQYQLTGVGGVTAFSLTSTFTPYSTSKHGAASFTIQKQGGGLYAGILAGVVSYGEFSGSGSTTEYAAFRAAAPQQQSGLTTSTGVITTASGLRIDDIRNGGLGSGITHAYALNQLGVNDTSRFNGNVQFLSTTTLAGNVTFSGTNLGMSGFNFLQTTVAGNNTAGSSAYHSWYDATSANGMLLQLNANNDLAFFGRTASVNQTSNITTIGRTGLITTATGITFGTTSTLNYYEEGTVTVTATCGTSGTVTLGANTLRFTRIGNVVYFTGLINVSSVSSPVGTFTLSGLPYTAGNSLANYAGVAVHALGLAATATTSIEAFILGNTKNIQIDKFSAGASAALAGDVTNSTAFRISGQYMIN